MLSNVKRLILNITDNCNLRCKYCFVNYQQTQISFELCKKIIDLLLTNNIDRELIFFGGEPLLLWDQIIVPIIEYTKKNNGKIKFSITTNGILLNKEKILYLKENNISILLSIDGNEYTQNFNRPFANGGKTFPILEKNLSLIQKELPTTTLRATLFPPTSHLLYDNFIYFNSLGFSACTFCPDEFSIWTSKQIQNIQYSLNKITLYYLNKKNFSIKFLPYEEMFSLINQTEGIFNQNNQQSKQCNNCGLAYKDQTLCINFEGKIFTCQELSSYNNLKNNYYCIGDIFSGIDLKKKANLWDQYINSKIICEDINYCSNCNIKNICSSKFCHANSFLKFKNLNTKSKITCIWQNLIYLECQKINFNLFQKILLKKE